MAKKSPAVWDVINYDDHGKQTKSTLDFEATIILAKEPVLYIDRDGVTGRIRYRSIEEELDTDTLREAFIKYTRELVNEESPEWIAQTDAAWIVWRGAHRKTRIKTFMGQWAKAEAVEKGTGKVTDSWAVVLLTQDNQRIRATTQERYQTQKIASYIAEQIRHKYEQKGWSKRFKEVLVFKGEWWKPKVTPARRLKIGRVEKTAKNKTLKITSSLAAGRMIQSSIVEGVCKEADVNADPLHVAISRWAPRVISFTTKTTRFEMSINKWSAAIAEQFSSELRHAIVNLKPPKPVANEFKRIAQLIDSTVRKLGREIKRITNDVYSKKSVALGHEALQWLDLVRAEEISKTLGVRSIIEPVNINWSAAKLEAFKEKLAIEALELMADKKNKKRKGKKRKSKGKARQPKITLTPEQAKSKVGQLLKALEKSTDKVEKRKLRIQLRRLGHQGGLQSITTKKKGK